MEQKCDHAEVRIIDCMVKQGKVDGVRADDEAEEDSGDNIDDDIDEKDQGVCLAAEAAEHSDGENVDVDEDEMQSKAFEARES